MTGKKILIVIALLVSALVFFNVHRINKNAKNQNKNEIAEYSFSLEYPIQENSKRDPFFFKNYTITPLADMTSSHTNLTV